MSSPFAFLFFFFFLVSRSHAFNITKILDGYKDFTDFNNLLTRSGLAKEINQQHTVTVLVVSNGNTAVLSGQSDDVIKSVLSVHVILDYYDEKKLSNLQRSKVPKTLTTLYQQTGLAQNQVGFLNMTNSDKGPTLFESAAPDNNVEAKLVKEITTQPYDISVLEVSNILNIASSIAKSPTASHSQAAKSPTVSHSRAAKSPTASHSRAAKSPTASHSRAPKASLPRKALTPAPADGPSGADDDASKSTSNTDEGKGEGDAADAPGKSSADAPGESSAVPVLYGDYLPSIVLMMLTWAWLLLAMV